MLRVIKLAFTNWLRHMVKLKESPIEVWSKLRLLWALTRLPKQRNPRDAAKIGCPVEGKHSKTNDRDAISFAYDLPAEFYALWLDKNLQYTCGYFASPDEDLDAAQERKVDLICRKLRLKPGEKFVDFGCGWGGLLIHATKHYGVHATGVTLAGEQARWCEQAIDWRPASATLATKIVYTDYRDFKAPAEFDKASSVGMTEHIGHEEPCRRSSWEDFREPAAPAGVLAAQRLTSARTRFRRTRRGRPLRASTCSRMAS